MNDPAPRVRGAPLVFLLTLLSGVLFVAALWRRQRPSGSPSSEPPASSLSAAPALAPLHLSAAVPRQTPMLEPEAVSPAWQEPTKYIMGVLLLLSGVVILLIGRDAIPLVIMAGLLALFLQPMVRFFMTRFRFPRGLAVAAPYVLVILALVVGLVVILPSALNALARLATLDLDRILSVWMERVEALRASSGQSPLLSTTLTPVLDELEKTLQRAIAGGMEPPTVDILLGSWANRLTDALGVLARVVTPVIGAIVSIFFVLLISLQMIVGMDALRAWHPELVPPRYRPEINVLTSNIVQTWVSFIRGQLTLMLLMGTLSTIGYLILGVPQAILFGVLAGLLELIPSLGPTLAAVPAVLFSLLLGSTVWDISNFPFALLVTGFCVLLQLLENQVIVPRVMGDAVKLPPLIVLIGVIVGASAFGILGAFLSTPVIATFDQVFRFTYRKIQEQPAVVEEAASPGLLDRVQGFYLQARKRLGLGKTEPPQPLSGV